MPNCAAVCADTVAISASWSGVGFGFTAQSPNAHSTPSMTIRKMELTTDAPGAVLMIWNEGLMVCAVVWAAPETIPSAIPLWTIIVA